MKYEVTGRPTALACAIATMVFGLTACGGSSGGDEESGATSVAKASAAASAATSAPTEPTKAAAPAKTGASEGLPTPASTIVASTKEAATSIEPSPSVATTSSAATNNTVSTVAAPAPTAKAAAAITCTINQVKSFGAYCSAPAMAVLANNSSRSFANTKSGYVGSVTATCNMGFLTWTAGTCNSAAAVAAVVAVTTAPFPVPATTAPTVTEQTATVRPAATAVKTAPADALAAATAAVTYKAPIVITAGGTYTGNWESNDPKVPAITVMTTAPVIIENCRIRSKAHLVSALLSGTNITVRNCIGEGLNPNVLDGRPGRFVTVYKPGQLVVERNTLIGTAGIYADGAGTSNSGILIRFNKARNIEGRLSDGAGGYSPTKFVATQLAQLNNVRATPGIQIAWNEVINEPRKSRVEDNINLFLSSGTATSPILIHNNYIQGAYPHEPTTDKYSGGGIVTDGDGTTLAAATGYIKIYRNQVVSTSNHGISIASGHHVVVVDNKMISSGLLADGKRIASANVGSTVWNYYQSALTTTLFTANSVSQNTVGWLNAKGEVNAWWFPACEVGMCTGNTVIKTPTLAMEAAEWGIWQTKLADNKFIVGSTLSN